MANLISELLELNQKGGDQKRVDEIEKEIAISLDDYAEENDFYNLPTKQISEIIEKCRTEDAVLICAIISKMNKYKNKNEACKNKKTI